MKFYSAVYISLLTVFIIGQWNLESQAFACLSGDVGPCSIDISGKFVPEFAWSKNASLLNNNVCADRAVYCRHRLDTTLDILFNKNQEELSPFRFRLSARNKGVWGDPESIAKTVRTEVKINESVVGEHQHALSRHIVWLREMWLSVPLGKLLCLAIDSSHHLKLGAFPFELGRGISLGSAYAVGPDTIGFFSDSVVDQYAFGGKLSGEFLKDRLAYDVYAGILDNKSASFGQTGRKIYGQQYGRYFCQERGFGKVNYLFAGRLVWNVFDKTSAHKLTLEPYALFNDDREQKVEFLGDAESKLGTIGFAGEYRSKYFDFGFDGAINVGRQRVRGWDRNTIRLENRDGCLIEVNSHIFDGASSDKGKKKVPFVSGGDAQGVIEQTRICAREDESFNDQAIGTITQGFCNNPESEVTLFNADNRFRNSYENSFKGWMCVVDAGGWIYDNDVYLAGTAGLASGDDNPNEETKDGVYSGFIGLQETYSGNRVRSAFLLGSAGKIKRPLSAPTSRQAPNRFASSVSGFSNLGFVGASLLWKPQRSTKKVQLHPNVLFYWQDHPTNKFDPFTKKDLKARASNFLGSEVNLFLQYYPLPYLKGFFVSSVFIPGKHYDDIKGKPLSSDQARALDRLDRTGVTTDSIPNISSDVALTISAGLEYLF